MAEKENLLAKLPYREHQRSIINTTITTTARTTRAPSACVSPARKLLPHRHLRTGFGRLFLRSKLPKPSPECSIPQLWPWAPRLRRYLAFFFLSQSRQSCRPSETGNPQAAHFFRFAIAPRATAAAGAETSGMATCATHLSFAGTGGGAGLGAEASRPASDSLRQQSPRSVPHPGAGAASTCGDLSENLSLAAGALSMG